MHIGQYLENEGIRDDIPFMLMSLREIPHLNILKGIKKYEFRSRFTTKESLAFIYVSKIRAVQSIIYFGEPIRGNAEELAIYDFEHSLNFQEQLAEYFHHRDGYAIPVKEIWKLKPIELNTIKNNIEGFVIPQSYYWLKSKPQLLHMLLEMEVQLC